jgi:class 3 adenylate cyclase
MNKPEIMIEERVIVSVDVHNFSMTFDGLVESSEFLQEMYEKLGDVICGYRGEIIKYFGDGILSILPAGCENEAVACGLEMRKVFAEMVGKRGLPGEPELEVGIGAGKVVVWECGHRTLRQKDVFGEEVNRTAMIGHFRGIAITESVYEQVKGTYHLQKQPGFKKKGRSFKVWAVVE